MPLKRINKQNGLSMAISFFEELKRRNVFKVAVAYLVLAWVVVQVTATAVPALHLPDWINTAVFFFGIVGFPFAIFFAWAFEITPDGVKLEADVKRDDSITNQTSQKLNVVIISLLIVALGYFFWKSQGTESEQVQPLTTETTNTIETSPVNGTSINPASIAVLAFADLSQTGDQEYFSDGISEEILNVLVKVKTLEVSSRTSAFQFKGQELGIPEIADKLQVRHVVEGSVRKSGGTIRITAQLIDAQNDKHLWSETYDRPFDSQNLFAIQDEIANSIVASLSQVLDIENISGIKITASTSDVTAYDLFLTARPLFVTRYDLDTADRLLTEAIELDPNFAKAWEIRAALQGLMVEYGYSTMSQQEVTERTIKFANKALSLNPDSATAIATLAKLRTNAVEELVEKHNIADILTDFDRALVIEPRNASALNWRGLLHLLLGNLRLAQADFDKCVKYEPYYEPCVENQLVTLGYFSSDEEVLNAYINTLNSSTHKTIFAPLPLLARMDEEIAFKSVTNLARMLNGWRRHDELYQAFKNLDADHSELVKDIRHFLANNDDRDTEALSFSLVHLGYSQGKNLYGTQWQKGTKRYRQSEQFHNYMKQSGIFDYWKQNGFPEQCKLLDDDDFTCD